MLSKVQSFHFQRLNLNFNHCVLMFASWTLITLIAKVDFVKERECILKVSCLCVHTCGMNACLLYEYILSAVGAVTPFINVTFY